MEVSALRSLNVGIGTGFTIDLWISPTDTSVEHPLVEWNTDFEFQSQFWHSVGGPGDLFANILSPDETYHGFQSVPGLVLVNVWQHVAVTYDNASGVSKLYLNGVVVAQQNLGSFTPLTSEAKPRIRPPRRKS
jgi:hypothetical protein